MDKLKMQSTDRTQDAISAIGALFPHTITEVQIDGDSGSDGSSKPKFKKAIDFDLLRQALSDRIVEDDTERYRLDWPGKRASLLRANTPITKTLRPAPAESLDWENTQNLYIEGDNLEALKILQESYLGKVKMIYIDPPYNTGNDFIYKDDFKKSRDEYEEEIGATDESGEKLFRNTDSNGRFHSDWLSMMYERLLVARDFLREDGVIFISIDDNEVHNLRKVCDEIFGEENFVASLIWKRRQNVDSRAKNGASTDHEYVIIYKKSNEGTIRGANKDLEKYSNPDNDSRGDWMSADMTGLATKDQRPNLHYNLEDPTTGIIYVCPPTGWRYEPKRMNELIKNNEVLFPKNPDGRPRRKKFRNDLESDFTGFSSMLKTVFNTQGTREVRTIFDEKEYFDFPKPVTLIQTLIQQGTSTTNSDIILDFFSGSATTAHAVMQLNAEDGGNRKFILVQLPEKTDEGSEAYKAGFTSIAEIGKERIRRAAKKIREDLLASQNPTGKGKSKKKVVAVEDETRLFEGEELGMDSEKSVDVNQLDLGFRVFKVDSSNLKDVFYNPGALSQEALMDLTDNVKADRTGEDLLIQVMLDLGLVLSLPVTTKKIKKNTVHFVDSNALVACFDPKMDFAIVDEIAEVSPLRVVFRDACFAEDKDRINVEERFKRLSPNTKVVVV